MSLNRETSPGYLTNLAARLFARALDRRIGDKGLASGQFPALLALWAREGLTQGELCRIAAVEQPTMANTLARMERDGLIRREPDPDDKRRSRIYLTDAARALEDTVTADAKAINAIATEGLSPEELAIAVKLLHRIIGNLEREVGIETGLTP